MLLLKALMLLLLPEYGGKKLILIRRRLLTAGCHSESSPETVSSELSSEQPAKIYG